MTDETNIFTDLWTVKLSDWQRGLICAVIATPVGMVYDWLNGDPITWKSVLKAAIAGGLAYIGKNFLTDKKGKFLTKIG